MRALASRPRFLLLLGFATCVAQNVASGGAGTGAAEAKDMALVGYHDLQARSAYQPVVREQNGRWIAYIGHHGGTEKVAKPVNPLTGKPEFNGTSVLDVTDRRAPRYLAHIPGEEGQGESGGAQMVRVCAGKDLPKGIRASSICCAPSAIRARNLGCDRSRQAGLLSRIGPLKGTHKNWWECDTGIAYLVSGVEGWRTRRMTQIYDLSDPAHPRFIRNFGLPGQQPGATGEAPVELHGPISTGPAANRVYFGYGTDKNGIMQIVDRQKLLTARRADRRQPAFPEVGRLTMPPNVGAHTAFPLLKMNIDEFARDKDGSTRDFVAIVDESLVNECAEARQMLWIADITTKRGRWAWRAGRCPRPAATSARAAGASGRIRPTKT